MNTKPKVLQLVEKQTLKSYGVREGGCRNIILPPADTPIFENTAICWACGKTRHVNAFGFCEDCWITHFRKEEPNLKGGG